MDGEWVSWRSLKHLVSMHKKNVWACTTRPHTRSVRIKHWSIKSSSIFVLLFVILAKNSMVGYFVLPSNVEAYKLMEIYYLSTTFCNILPIFLNLSTVKLHWERMGQRKLYTLFTRLDIGASIVHMPVLQVIAYQLDSRICKLRQPKWSNITDCYIITLYA